MTNLPGLLGLSLTLAEGRHCEALRYLTVRNLVRFKLLELHYRPHDGPHDEAHPQGRRR